MLRLPESLVWIAAAVLLQSAVPGVAAEKTGSRPGKVVDMTAGRRHWALQPLGHPVPPEVAEFPGTGSEQAVDRFWLAALREAGLTHSGAADRRTLLRRLTATLTGLPPSVEEMASFLQDPAPDAYARALERLLASPAHGEHWARHWLDVARYSDTKGYVYTREEKNYVHAWRYRDWVVRALNDDMPYDRFLLLQLAADRVEPEGSPHLAAMGFLTLGRRFLGVTHDIIDDRIHVVMSGTQALTVACARCHDHKSDPLTTRDYYALYGIFKSSAEKLVPAGEAPPPDAAYAAELAAREEKLRSTMAQRRKEQAARVRGAIDAYLLAQFELEKYPDEIFGQIVSAEDVNALVVRRWQSWLVDAARRGDPLFSAWLAYAALEPETFAARSPEVTQELLQRPAGQVSPLVKAAFAQPPVDRQDAARRYAALFSRVDQAWHAMLTAQPDATSLTNPDEEAARQVLYGPQSPCMVPDEDISNIEMYFPTDAVEELWKLQGEVDRWLLQSPSAPPRSLILTDRAQPVEPRVFKRGNPLMKGDAVARRYLEVLGPGGEPPPYAAGSGRLELAQAIASPENPLTARVIVNRVWMHHFGRGLVASVSDFGVQAGPPSHPALLDWLARDLIEHGWSLKHLHRRILLSAAWQQTSRDDGSEATARAREQDPANRLLWRMTPRRLSIEEMRDAWLAAGGELDSRVAGPPGNLLAAGNHRRTLYAHVDREELPAVLRTFDFANPDLSIPQRSDTVVPQQALFTMNDAFPAARARALAARAQAAPGAPKDQVRRLYQFVYQRDPAAEETQAALEFLSAAPVQQETQRHPDDWSYGTGEWDASAGQVQNFTPLAHLSGEGWRGAEAYPGGASGWAQLTAAGGHPGNTPAQGVVRRWTAPADGVVSIQSTLQHEPAEGDGIRAVISHSGSGPLAISLLHHGQTALSVPALPVRKGDTVDFLVDIHEGLNSDQFLWAPRISAVDGGTLWDAAADFPAASATQPLTPWQQLAQTLLLTNEFLFID